MTVDERPETFVFDEAAVTLPVPSGARFTELEGLQEGARHLTWTAAPESFFMISAGASSGYTAEGMLSGEAQRGTGLRVESDEPVPLAGEGARRVAFRVTHRRPAEVREAPGGGSVRAPESEVRQLSDLLFVPGEHQHLRVGYRVVEDAPDELRGLLAHMLDRVEVSRRDA